MSQDAIQEQLKQTQLAYQMATEMSTFKAGFLARISHELRSPLNSLIGLHQLILSDLCDSPEEEREFIGQAHSSALKLMKLIDEVIYVSKTEQGTNQLEIQPLQLNQVLEEVYNLTHLQVVNRGFRVEILPFESEIYILADPKRLRQVLVNLVENAIKGMQEGSIKISVHPATTADYIHIWVDAQFPPEFISEPIDLLQSVSNTQGQFNKSTVKPNINELGLSSGLNLLINQTLLEAMQGQLKIVEVQTDELSSTCTRIQCSLPLISETASPQQEQE